MTSRSPEDRATLLAAQAIKSRERREHLASRPAKVATGGEGQRKPRELDAGYLHWLHDLPCIACLVEGVEAIERFYLDRLGNRHSEYYPIEAAHQKHTDLRGAALGKRPSDSASCPLCSWHHRIAPDACDPAQRKFWDRLHVDVGAYCKALYNEYKADGDGKSVVETFAKATRNV